MEEVDVLRGIPLEEVGMLLEISVMALMEFLLMEVSVDMDLAVAVAAVELYPEDPGEQEEMVVMAHFLYVIGHINNIIIKI